LTATGGANRKSEEKGRTVQVEEDEFAAAAALVDDDEWGK
jgi:hypothetical protein